MDEGLAIQAREWFERGSHDLDTARQVYDGQGHMDMAALHIHQAIEKYLEGLLVLKNRPPPRTHNLGLLLNLLLDVEPSLEAFAEFCSRASRYYLENRYPPGPPARYDRQEIGRDLNLASAMVGKIATLAGQPDNR